MGGGLRYHGPLVRLDGAFDRDSRKDCDESLRTTGDPPTVQSFLEHGDKHTWQIMAHIRLSARRARANWRTQPRRRRSGSASRRAGWSACCRGRRSRRAPTASTRSRIRTAARIAIECSPGDGDKLPTAFVDYEEQPREYTLCTVTTTIEVQTRISDLYRSPMDQVREQLAVLVEMVKERQENELINNANYGLLEQRRPVDERADAQGTADARRSGRADRQGVEGAGVLPGAPARIAAFGRECTSRGVPPPTVTLFGSPFLTWRGLPLDPVATS